MNMLFTFAIFWFVGVVTLYIVARVVTRAVLRTLDEKRKEKENR